MELKNRSESNRNNIDMLNYVVIFIMTLWLMALANSVTSLTCFLVGLFIISLSSVSFFRLHYKSVLIFMFFRLFLYISCCIY